MLLIMVWYTMILSKVRPFELALVKDPAFGKHKAMVRGVCRDEKTVCRNRLAYASVIPEGIENINTDSNVINNMSNKNAVEVPEVKVENPVATVAAVSEENRKVDEVPLKDDTVEKKEIPAAVVKEPVKEEQSAPKNETGNNKELDELRAQLEKQAKEIEERKRTYRNDSIVIHT